MTDTVPNIPTDRLEAVCKMGGGAECCRFIVAGREGIGCAKHEPELASQINWRVAFGAFVAVGDNCEGLRHDEA
jgi:hypothetical protein